VGDTGADCHLAAMHLDDDAVMLYLLFDSHRCASVVWYQFSYHSTAISVMTR
jgi:hypothetical protein